MYIKKTILIVIILVFAFYGLKKYFDLPYNHPKYLYKVLSIENWEHSKNQHEISLPEMDRQFIHFSTKQQLDKIIEKYWNGVTRFVLLTIDTTKLPGTLMLESNPGGTTKYYHLYDGSIPREAIIKTKIIEK
jgi:uncharacterized protein (DUF952 family)